MGFNTIYIGYLQFVKYTFLRLGQYQLRIRIICKNSIKYTYSKSSSLYISTFLQTIKNLTTETYTLALDVLY